MKNSKATNRKRPAAVAGAAPGSVTTAAHEHVESMQTRSDSIGALNAPLWYGWALRDAFEAGSRWQKKQSPNSDVSGASDASAPRNS